MSYNFKDYLNDPKKIIEYGLNYTYEDFDNFHNALAMSCNFLGNDNDFNDFVKSELKDIIGKWIFWGSTPVELTIQKIKECIIKHSLTHSFEATVNQIKQWENGYDLYYILPIYGIFPTSQTFLTNNIRLINNEGLPISRLKADMIKKRNQNDSYAEGFLEIKIGHYNLADKANIDNYDDVRKQFQNDFEETTKTLKYLLPLLPLIVSCGCIPYYESIYLINGFYYDDYTILENPDFLKRLQNTDYRYIQMTNESEINAEIVNKFFALPEKIRDGMVPALEYYNKYLLCHSSQYADAAIFLRIALETLLLNGAGPKKYQVSHRAAYLLNSNINIVNDCRDNGYIDDVYRFSALYAMTSNFVHGDESYDPSSNGFGYTSVSQGYLSNLLVPVRKIFINYIETLLMKSSQILNEEFYNDYIFRAKIDTIKSTSHCNSNKCIEIEKYFEKIINELIAYESRGFSKDRFMLFKIFSDKLNMQYYKYKQISHANLFCDINDKLINFDALRESSKRFLTALLDNYYYKTGQTNIPAWIIDYTAKETDNWINLDDKIASPNYNTSHIERHFAIRKLIPTALPVNTHGGNY